MLWENPARDEPHRQARLSILEECIAVANSRGLSDTADWFRRALAVEQARERPGELGASPYDSPRPNLALTFARQVDRIKSGRHGIGVMRAIPNN